MKHHPRAFERAITLAVADLELEHLLEQLLPDSTGSEQAEHGSLDTMPHATEPQRCAKCQAMAETVAKLERELATFLDAMERALEQGGRSTELLEALEQLTTTIHPSP